MEAPMSEAPELKPCPFCGSGPATSRQNASFSGVELLNDYSHDYSHDGYIVNWVHCGTCGAHGSSEMTSTEAVAAWNRRADLPPTDAQLATDPRVRGLVEVLEWALRYQPKDDSCESWVSDARLALAALAAQGGER
jgi:Lar family restriction alleviation protein